jgi:hypothetical protein
MQYFVVMIDYGRRGREAIVDPEITRREVISRVASGEYRNISFIHEIADAAVDDITAEILAEAAIPDIQAAGADLQASHFDHARDLRKHEVVWRWRNPDQIAWAHRAEVVAWIEAESVRATTSAGRTLQSTARGVISSNALWCHISASASSRQLSIGRNAALWRHKDSMARQ